MWVLPGMCWMLVTQLGWCPTIHTRSWGKFFSRLRSVICSSGLRSPGRTGMTMSVTRSFPLDDADAEVAFECGEDRVDEFCVLLVWHVADTVGLGHWSTRSLMYQLVA